MIKPTTTFPLRTKSPKDWITWPEEPELVRMFLVVDTLMPRRKRVVTSKRDGNMENSKGSRIVMVMIKIIIERDMLIMIATSTKAAGSGMINNRIIVSTNSTIE